MFDRENWLFVTLDPMINVGTKGSIDFNVDYLFIYLFLNLSVWIGIEIIDYGLNFSFISTYLVFIKTNSLN